jgi:hypothetical protein
MTSAELKNSNLPGADLIERGLSDLAQRAETVESLLVSIASPRLTALGFVVGPRFEDAEMRLYRRLATEFGDSAHSRYNALIRRIVSFQRAAACAR